MFAPFQRQAADVSGTLEQQLSLLLRVFVPQLQIARAALQLLPHTQGRLRPLVAEAQGAVCQPQSRDVLRVPDQLPARQIGLLALARHLHLQHTVLPVDLERPFRLRCFRCRLFRRFRCRLRRFLRCRLLRRFRRGVRFVCRVGCGFFLLVGLSHCIGKKRTPAHLHGQQLSEFGHFPASVRVFFSERCKDRLFQNNADLTFHLIGRKQHHFQVKQCAVPDLAQLLCDTDTPHPQQPADLCFLRGIRKVEPVFHAAGMECQPVVRLKLHPARPDPDWLRRNQTAGGRFQHIVPFAA